MTCNFTSFSTVFQSYQDDWWVIKKGCVLRMEKISASGKAHSQTARSIGQSLTYWVTGAPIPKVLRMAKTLLSLDHFDCNRVQVPSV